MSDASKPALPESYVTPTVWEEGDQGASPFASMNRPTAGARSDDDLPRGKHDLQLYSLGTPNGVKVTILLEELGVDYDAWQISISQLKQFTKGFVSVNPNSKIPALLDYSHDPPVRVFESGSILLYLAEKYGKFIPKDFRKKTECINWLMWNMGTAPFIGGGFGHFYKYAPIRIEYAINRYAMEAKRIMDVLDQHLGAGNEYVAGDEYSIADMAIMPWIMCIEAGYNGTEFLQTKSYKNVQAWMAKIGEREAVKRGRRVNGFGPDAVVNRHSPEDFLVEPKL